MACPDSQDPTTAPNRAGGQARPEAMRFYWDREPTKWIWVPFPGSLGVPSSPRFSHTDHQPTRCRQAIDVDVLVHQQVHQLDVCFRHLLFLFLFVGSDGDTLPQGSRSANSFTSVYRSSSAWPEKAQGPTRSRRKPSPHISINMSKISHNKPTTTTSSEGGINSSNNNNNNNNNRNQHWQ